MTRSIMLTAIAMFGATPAFAHPGGHDAMAFEALATHLASHPFHVAGLLAVAGVIAAIGLMLRHRKPACNKNRRAD